MDSYTVILAYPNLDDDDNVETYIQHTLSGTPRKAAEIVQEMASTDNFGLISPDAFQVLAVFPGDLELLLDRSDFAHTNYGS